MSESLGRSILIDGAGLQARQHLLARTPERRLSAFCELAGRVAGRAVEFTRVPWGIRARAALGISPWRGGSWPIPAGLGGTLPDAAALRRHDLLVLTTRDRLAPYTPRELDDIEAFVRDGGALWVMANHAHVPGTSMGDFTTQDRRLLARFGIELVDACFETPGQFSRLPCDGPGLSPAFPGADPSRAGFSLVVNNCCGLRARDGKVTIPLHPEMVDRGPQGFRPDDCAFAVALDRRGRAGRVLAMADSGFIAEEGVPGSGPGLIGRGDNREFVLGALRWLLGPG